MTIPNLPAQGDTAWYEWATGLDAEARKVVDKLDTATASSTYQTLAGLAEAVQDIVGTALVAGTNVTVTVDDVADTITIATTATVNATDAALRDRATHTGEQAISTVTGLQAALDAKVGSDGTILQAVKITQVAYDALVTKVATTLYVIA